MWLYLNDWLFVYIDLKKKKSDRLTGGLVAKRPRHIRAAVDCEP